MRSVVEGASDSTFSFVEELVDARAPEQNVAAWFRRETLELAQEIAA